MNVPLRNSSRQFLKLYVWAAPINFNESIATLLLQLPKFNKIEAFYKTEFIIWKLVAWISD